MSLKSTTILAILLASIAFAQSKDCLKACTMEYNPICASNGKEFQIFGNPCQFEIANCEDSVWTKAHSMADCQADTTEIAAEPNCEKPCTFDFNPVCGSNGEAHQVFDNLCQMENAHCMDNKVWFQTLMTDCLVPIAAKDDCNKPCTREFNLVCGFNGETHKVFNNLCELNNAHCADGKTWSQTLMTDCLTPIAAKDDCNKPCTREFNLVCGFNGETHKVFNNLCELNNAHCADGKTWSQTLMTDCLIPTAAKDDCNKACTREYKPVCGYNGKTHKVFSNLCELNNAHCADGKTWSQTLMTDCLTPIAAKDDCNKACTREYKPVCGFNGENHQIFNNLCELNNAHCADGKAWFQSSITECFIPINAKDNCNTACTLEYDPVCGFNGEVHQLFGNPCGLKNAHCEDGKTWVQTRLTECKIPVAVKEDCTKACTREYNPVCGFNGEEHKLFGNPCEFKNAQCQGKTWSKMAITDCLTPAKIDTKCEIPCTREYLPVCGFNGEDYQVFSNACELKNAHCKDANNWSKVIMARCLARTSFDTKCEKPCTRELSPICGFNGERHQIFSNKCLMENEHCNDGKQWSQTRFEDCEVQQIAADNQKLCEVPCTREYNPVCGYNGKTHKIFGNKCVMNNEHCKDGQTWLETRMSECSFRGPSDNTNDCPQICPLIYSPTCGFDGNTYQMFNNLCEMEVKNCNQHTNFQRANLNNCKHAIKSGVEKDCPQMCPMIYAPTCGFDGSNYQMFSSPCEMKVYNCNKKTKYQLSRLSDCQA